MLHDDMLNHFRGQKILVTGGTGLIGRQVVDLLATAGAAVRVVSLDAITVDDRAEHVRGDLTDLGFCKAICRDTDMVCHLAGIKGSAAVSVSQPASHFVPTLMMNTNLLEAARQAGITRLVYTSSIGAYASADVFREDDYRLDSLPMDFAGWSKRVAELQIAAYRDQYGLSGYAIVRPCNVYGPGDNFDPQNAMVIPALLSRIHRGETPLVVWGDGSAVRDIAYSRDVAEGVLLALFHGTGDSFVNLGSGTGVSVAQIVEALHTFLDFEHVFDPTKPTGYPRRVMDIARARDTLGYAPTTSLADGLKKTWEWFLANEDEYLHKQNYFAPSHG